MQGGTLLLFCIQMIQSSLQAEAFVFTPRDNPDITALLCSCLHSYASPRNTESACLCTSFHTPAPWQDAMGEHWAGDPETETCARPSLPECPPASHRAPPFSVITYDVKQ